MCIRDSSSGPSGQLREVTAPTSYLGGKSIPTSERDVPLRHVPLEFTSAEMLPSEDATLFAAEGIELSPRQANTWRDIANASMPSDSPIWLGGYPALLQDDLTPYCVHQAAGIESPPLDEEIQLSSEVLRAAKDLVLLAQFNRDEGSAYFYMSRQALQAREFDKAQLWVQRD